MLPFKPLKWSQSSRLCNLSCILGLPRNLAAECIQTTKYSLLIGIPYSLSLCIVNTKELQVRFTLFRLYFKPSRLGFSALCILQNWPTVQKVDYIYNIGLYSEITDCFVLFFLCEDEAKGCVTPSDKLSKKKSTKLIHTTCAPHPRSA